MLLLQGCQPVSSACESVTSDHHGAVITEAGHIRVGFFGNVCNMLYHIATAVRECSNIETRLFIPTGSALQDDPGSEASRLQTNTLEWVQYGDYLPSRWFLWPSRSSVVPLLSQCDLVIASGQGPMIAQFACRPMVLFAMGGDLTVDPFPWRFMYLYPRAKDKLGLLCKGYWQKKALRRVCEFWVQQFYPNMHALARLNIQSQKVFPQYFPVVIDTEALAYRVKPRCISSHSLPGQTGPDDFLVFHPARIQIDDYAKKGAEGQSKRNDILLRGFAAFCLSEKAGTVRLILIERSASMDVPKAKRLIEELGITKNVVWLRASRPEGFSKEEMVDIYSRVDVVADQFSDVGWFGNVTLEGCACSRPVVTRVNESVLKKMYPWHPLLHAGTEEEIAKQLLRLYRDRGWRYAQGQLCRKWVEDFHSYASAGPLYVKRINELVETYAF